jgi:hypothetical protein
VSLVTGFEVVATEMAIFYSWRKSNFARQIFSKHFWANKLPN